jgi:hypothetical protein
VFVRDTWQSLVVITAPSGEATRAMCLGVYGVTSLSRVPPLGFVLFTFLLCTFWSFAVFVFCRVIINLPRFHLFCRVIFPCLLLTCSGLRCIRQNATRQYPFFPYWNLGTSKVVRIPILLLESYDLTILHHHIDPNPTTNPNRIESMLSPDPNHRIL